MSTTTRRNFPIKNVHFPGIIASKISVSTSYLCSVKMCSLFDCNSTIPTYSEPINVSSFQLSFVIDAFAIKATTGKTVTVFISRVVPPLAKMVDLAPRLAHTASHAPARQVNYFYVFHIFAVK